MALRRKEGTLRDPRCLENCGARVASSCLDTRVLVLGAEEGGGDEGSVGRNEVAVSGRNRKVCGFHCICFQ